MGETLTKSDVRKIEEEIEYRKLTVRKEAIAAVKEARAHGDLSENFEYHAAKRDKNKNESRIRYLERMLKTAVVVSDKSEDGVVLKIFAQVAVGPCFFYRLNGLLPDYQPAVFNFFLYLPDITFCQLLPHIILSFMSRKAGIAARLILKKYSYDIIVHDKHH